MDDELIARMVQAMVDSDDWVPYEGIGAEPAAVIALREIRKTHVLIAKHDARIQWADTLLLRDEDGADTR
jgi:hypothetical protein